MNAAEFLKFFAEIGDEIDSKSSIESTRKGCQTHQDCHQWGECVFESDGKPNYCRCRGWYVGDGINHCGPPGGLYLLLFPSIWL